VNASENEVKSAILSFVGEYMQVPPMYSALKVNGQKLCNLARKGVTVERKARPVTIHGIEILSIDLPEVRMRVHCSKGTYIRTLCQDIGEKLGCGGCMKSLLRTRVAAFALKDALKLDELESKLKSGDESFIHSVDSVFGQYEKASVLETADKLVRNGNRIPEEFIDHMQDTYKQECIRLYGWEQTFIGLYAYMPETKDFKPIKLFQTEL
jgi:tRNA pseudouridine55 synthase